MCQKCDDEYAEHQRLSKEGKDMDDKMTGKHEEPERQITDGDVVALASDGPEMVVENLSTDGKLAHCAWFPEDGAGNFLQPLTRSFYITSLILIEKVEDRE